MTVYLVGAGPGDPELLTLKADRLLRQADVVVHDRLVGPEVLERIAPWAELLDVGKDPYGKRVGQAEINEILIDRGGRFQNVVRLKGGDPFVFGRGGEEALALATAGIACEVVPGITSAIAGPAEAGVPVTQRGVSSAFTVVTAHQDPANDSSLDWSGLAKLGTTLVVLMGATRALAVRDRLVGGGLSAETPVAIITNATRPNQTTTRLSLAELGLTPVVNPSIIVIGDVAGRDLHRASATEAALLPQVSTSLFSKESLEWS